MSHTHKIQTVLGLIFLGIGLMSCTTSQKEFDATGSFEAIETVISAESAGKILRFDVQEGQKLEENQKIGYIDTLQLHLKKRQLEAQVLAVLSRKPNVSVQLATLQEQLKTAEKEEVRVANLVKADAATSKQWDDIKAQIEVIKRQITAQKSSLEITTTSLKNETEPLQIQIEQLDDQIKKSVIKNPISGTVLTKYAEPNEMTAPGKPLYKIADVSTLVLRVFVTNNQLAQIKLNQTCTVRTDDGKGGFRTTKGELFWISEKAEFTPKTIQTKDERANRVYAVKIRVANDGFLKLGMYGEVQLNQAE